MNQNVTINFAPLLVITSVILAVLKVTGKLAISWWLVTAPLWIGLAIAIGFFALFALVGCIARGGRLGPR